ncbi:unnamed protein product [Triticum turgidum subsp. durum]|uniref:HAT C-terminal dimerisation domain-containing protein n=1 Tax=Triticum turgidum subsp. durum TaxID=4567 RepID=A0A9R0VT91_TRITD|nr:unnamed protein product [Triticum turgidum subsp. durum]
MVKEKGNEKGKGAGKENAKAKAKEKSMNYLIRQDSALPPPVPRKKKKPKVQIRKAKDFPNAPAGELICRLKKHPPPPPRLPDRTGAGVRAAEAAASGSATCSELPHAPTIEMGEAMLEKFDKYWEEKNNAMVIATIFDPRYKIGYIGRAFGELYGEGSTRFRSEIKIVEKELAALYDKCVAQDKRAGNGESSSSSTNIPSILVQAGYESFLSSCSTRISKSELRNYLEDEVAPRNKALDLLGWWKDNAPRYPIMAKIARRFLTIPATSVSSESTFSTTGRILGMSTRTIELWL